MLGQTANVMNELSHSVARADAASRDEMLRRMGELFSGVSHLLDSSGLETFDAIFVSLVPACSAAARAHLSEVVARNERGPRRAVRHLAFDDEIMVARPVITLSPLLLDEDQLALATVKSMDHLAALCERSTLTTGVVTDIILSRADGRIRVALAANAGGERLSVRGEAMLSDPRSRTTRSPTRWRSACARRTPGRPRPGRRRTACVPINPALTALDKRAGGAARSRRHRPGLTVLAKALGLPSQPVAKAFAVDIHGGFLAYARAANLYWETAERFIAALEAGNVPPRLQRAERDFRPAHARRGAPRRGAARQARRAGGSLTAISRSARTGPRPPARGR